MSAVSMKLIPASSAAWMIRIESSWSGLPHDPNIIAPRQSSLTETPVRPSSRCSMKILLVSGLAGPLRGAGVGVRRRPAAEEPEGLLVARARLGGVGEDREPAVGGEIEALEVQLEVADDRVAEALDAVEVEAYVVRGPVGAELLAPRRELADEVREVAIVGVAAGGGAQDGDGVA